MPKQTDTKNLIINTALDLFSKRGFDGVGMRDIAQLVGVRESAIYKHFKSKQDIFDKLVECMYSEYCQFAMSISVSEDTNELIEKYKVISENDLLMICNGFFLYFAKDEKAAKFRKVLTMEQYRNETIGNLDRELYFENVLKYLTQIFKGLIDSKIIISVAPDIVALHFYSPIFLLLTRYDKQTINEADALQELGNHVRQFRQIYYREQ